MSHYHVDSIFTCGAEMSSDEIYRYNLTRGWEDNGPCVAFLMFNPSTADRVVNDHTISKCIGFSKIWGYGRMVVVNLYAVKSRDPKAVARIGTHRRWARSTTTGFARRQGITRAYLRMGMRPAHAVHQYPDQRGDAGDP